VARASCAMVRVRSRARRTNDRANLDAPLRQVQPHAVSFRVGVGSSARIRPLRGSTTSSTGHLVGGHLVGGHLVGGHLVGGHLVGGHLVGGHLAWPLRRRRQHRRPPRRLPRHHVTSAVLHSSVDAKKREAWVDARLREGVQVLITHPKCVQTGLDLLAFPTLVFYQCEYSAYVVGQASRRGWRIGQRADVHVYHVVYANSARENAPRLVARKRRAAKLVDGDLDEDGLVAEIETDGPLKELARSLVDGDPAAAVESAEEILA